MYWKQITLLVMLIVFFFWAIISWVFWYHLKKYSVTQKTAWLVFLAYLAGSVFFLILLFWSGFSFIASLQ